MLCEENKLPLRVAVRNQYIYKLWAYSSYFCALVIAQVIAVLMSLGGTTISSLTGIGTNVTVHAFSTQLAVVFTEFWAVIISVLLTTRQNKNESFAMPSNRMSDCLSDIAFMLTGCIFGGVTTALLTAAMRTPVFLMYSGGILAKGFYPAAYDMCVIGLSTMLYMLLFSAAGYLAGVLVRFSKIFVVIYPAVFIGAIILEKNSPKSQTFFRICWSGILYETSLGIFALKIIIISVLAFAVGAAVSNRMEVRK